MSVWKKSGIQLSRDRKSCNFSCLIRKTYQNDTKVEGCFGFKIIVVKVFSKTERDREKIQEEKNNF